MAEYIYTIKDRETGEILLKGLCAECCAYLGCSPSQISALATIPHEYKVKTKFSKYKVERFSEDRPQMGGKRLTDTVCVDCGAKLEQVGANRKRCDDCAKKRNRKNRAEYMRRVRQTTGRVEHPKPVKDYCEGCIFYDGEYDSNKCCNYFLDTGMRRPCPPGKGCTVKKTKKAKAERELLK